LNKYVIDSCKIIEETSSYVLYSFYNYSLDPKILHKINKIEKNMLDQTVSIQEVRFDLKRVLEGNILKELFAKYFKENFIIPYDIKARKRLYKRSL
jgi:hypothetical protein